MLGRRIAAHQPPPTCLPELRWALLDEWCNIPQDQIDNLILSMAFYKRTFCNGPRHFGQVKKTTPELASPLLISTPHQRENI
ncbi:transposable element Tcb2 transposase [Trichonephila clavipes]|nr:transposable element Tcb2 transposase [Trichonephila clavipes]